MALDDQPIYSARHHWILFAVPVGLAVLYAVLAIASWHPLGPASLFFFAGVPLLLALAVAIRYRTAALHLTSQRVLFLSGWPGGTVHAIPLSKVESISVRRSVIGRLLGYGTVTVTGSGGSVLQLHFARDPVTFEREGSRVIASS